MNELNEISQYSQQELNAADWPAIQRYLKLIERTAQTPSEMLRLQRHRAWLRCALATYFNRASAKDICLWWSHQADQLLTEAWRVSGMSRHPYALIALGKLGSEELNLSSDVDLVIVRNDEAEVDMRALREFQTLLSETTEFGFCLRVDLTLRPGGRSSAIIPSYSEFENHYGSHGETWERLAFVRQRVIAGHPELVKPLVSFMGKYVYRKHLDFTLLEDLRLLRSKIRQEKFESRAGLFHLKLGEGGIRDLELFVHALQVIHGGRHALLRTHSTTIALERLRDNHLLPIADADFLRDAYWYLRDLENRLHAYEDQQTYAVDFIHPCPALPLDFQNRLQVTCIKVNEVTSTLLGVRSENIATESVDVGDEAVWLKRLGYSQPSIENVWPALLEATALSRKSERDEKARIEFLKSFVLRISEIGLDLDLGLSLLLDFVKAIRAKASFFTLLNREPRIRNELASLFSISPYLGSILASRPELIDEFILSRQAAPSENFDALLDELAERRLLAELISANHFLTDLDLPRLLTNLSENADAICTILLNRIKTEYGPSTVELLALGKWGGREVGLRSDLDFIFLSQDEPTALDQKVARRFLARMTEAHRGGSIYAVDMRLRPSGNAGPILVSQGHLEDYLRTRAAAWERQAYLKSRALSSAMQISPAQISSARRLSESDFKELAEIRARLFLDETPGELDLKLSFGGLADIEFTAQIALLYRGEFSIDPSTRSMIKYLEGVDSTWQKFGADLRQGYEELRRIEQLFQLTVSSSGSKMRTKSDEFKRLALVMKRDPSRLETDIRFLFQANREALESVRTIRL